MGERPATCPSCSKRMSKKQWYYRNGQYFCSKGCWETAKSKAEAEGAKTEKVAPTAEASPASSESAKSEKPAAVSAEPPEKSEPVKAERPTTSAKAEQIKGEAAQK